MRPVTIVCNSGQRFERGDVRRMAGVEFDSVSRVRLRSNRGSRRCQTVFAAIEVPKPMYDWIAQLLARAGRADRARQLPAWALLFHSPFGRCDDATSWIGGAPKAPGNFAWPKDTDGTPLHFIAQIDLAALAPEPQTGLRPPGLPAEGALLAFIGRSWPRHPGGRPCQPASSTPLIGAPCGDAPIADVLGLSVDDLGGLFTAHGVPAPYGL
jgi:hypothetical protein